MLLPHDAMLARYMLRACVCSLSVCHKSRFYQAAKSRTTQTKQRNSPETVVLWSQLKSWTKFD